MPNHGCRLLEGGTLEEHLRKVKRMPEAPRPHRWRARPDGFGGPECARDVAYGCKPANAGFLRQGRQEDMLRLTVVFDSAHTACTVRTSRLQ